jgi:hypothetical protein
VRLEGLGKLKKFIHQIGSRTRELLVCSTVPPTWRSEKLNFFQNKESGLKINIKTEEIIMKLKP